MSWSPSRPRWQGTRRDLWPRLILGACPPIPRGHFFPLVLETDFVSCGHRGRAESREQAHARRLAWPVPSLPHAFIQPRYWGAIEGCREEERRGQVGPVWTKKTLSKGRALVYEAQSGRVSSQVTGWPLPGALGRGFGGVEGSGVMAGCFGRCSLGGAGNPRLALLARGPVMPTPCSVPVLNLLALAGAPHHTALSVILPFQWPVAGPQRGVAP